MSGKRGAGHSTSLQPLYSNPDFNQNVRTTMWDNSLNNVSKKRQDRKSSRDELNLAKIAAAAKSIFSLYFAVYFPSASISALETETGFEAGLVVYK